LSSFVYRKKYTDDEGKRMSAVFEYAIEFFHEAITLEEVAEKANMSKNAFCRYFKKRTNKTFFQFLIEVRIENACKLLSNNNKDLTISSISEMCGFQDIANFNRKFKELKGISPSQYRSKF
jgi:AraC-like DNA-binding protein